MLLVASVLLVICAILSCTIAYMIFKASQAQQSHKARLLAIQKRLAEKQANPDSPRPLNTSGRETPFGLRNSQLDQIVGRLHDASSSSLSGSPNPSKARPSESTTEPTPKA
jgi:hypothetical protein